MLIRLAVLFLFVLFVSCNSSFNERYVYVEGEIFNPVDRFVSFSGDCLEYDKILLDSNNRFKVKIKVSNRFNVYRFQHGAEWQYIYVEPEDTLKFRLDTECFDESMCFEGKSKSENDLLAKAYLDNDAENKYFDSLYRLPFAAFVEKYDSIAVLKEQNFKELKSSNKHMSDDYFKVLEVSFLYDFYLRMEEYSVVNCPVKCDSLGFDMDRFLLNRRKFNLEDQSLIFYEPYFRLVKFIADSNSILKGYSFLTDNFTSSCLQTIDFIVKDSVYKQKMLSVTTFNFLCDKSSEVACDYTKKTFLRFSHNEYDKRVLRNFINDISKVKKGSEIVDFKVLDEEKKQLSIQKLVKGKKSLLLFHNVDYLPKHYLVKFVKKIRLDYPELSVFVVNLNGDLIKSDSDPVLRDCYYSFVGENRLDFNKSHCLRVLLVDSEGIVFTDFMTVDSVDLFGKIEKLYKA